MASRPETIALMKRAQALSSKGHSVASIAKLLGKSESRIHEYLEGINWNSKTGNKKKIA